MRVALDAMGGDTAPAEPVQGALEALRDLPEVEVILVGDEARIRATLEEFGGADEKALRIHHAPERIEMGESPVTALRSKPNSSVGQTIALVTRGEADAAVSAGNTGAFVAAAMLGLKMLAGIRRPGICVSAPNVEGYTSVIDMGANVHCKPIHLYQYAVMAGIYHQRVVGVERPRVGLLNVGSEAGKGTNMAREVHAMLNASHLNFVGNVEGGDIFNGSVDVAVCDGFTGNLVLKAVEGMGEGILQSLLAARDRDVWSRLGLKLLKPVLEELLLWMDFAEYGGAPLLGVERECIICHGRSDARAFKNAVRAAQAFARQDVNGHIEKTIAAERDTVAAPNETDRSRNVDTE